MFTGIVEEVGRIITADRKGNSARLKIEAEKVLEDIKIGDSIAVNGICLTVTSFGKNYFTADGCTKRCGGHRLEKQRQAAR